MLFIKVYEEKETFNANLVHIISFPKENDYDSNKRIHLQIKNHSSQRITYLNELYVNENNLIFLFKGYLY